MGLYKGKVVGHLYTEIVFNCSFNYGIGIETEVVVVEIKCPIYLLIAARAAQQHRPDNYPHHVNFQPPFYFWTLDFHRLNFSRSYCILHDFETPTRWPSAADSSMPPAASSDLEETSLPLVSLPTLRLVLQSLDRDPDTPPGSP